MTCAAEHKILLAAQPRCPFSLLPLDKTPSGSHIRSASAPAIASTPSCGAQLLEPFPPPPARPRPLPPAHSTFGLPARLFLLVPCSPRCRLPQRHPAQRVLSPHPGRSRAAYPTLLGSLPPAPRADLPAWPVNVHRLPQEVLGRPRELAHLGTPPAPPAPLPQSGMGPAGGDLLPFPFPLPPPLRSLSPTLAEARAEGTRSAGRVEPGPRDPSLTAAPPLAPLPPRLLRRH